MAQILNFKSEKISAASRSEAVKMVNFSVEHDATPAYKRWLEKQEGDVTAFAERQFMLDYLEARSKNAPGIGFYITLESAVANTRERPYSIHDKKNEKGKRKMTTTYQLIGENREILGEATGTKGVAKNLAKEIIINGYKGHIDCVLTKQVTEGENIAFTVDYTPSKGTRNGTWILFGIENV